jgi:hypothetical protein
MKNLAMSNKTKMLLIVLLVAIAGYLGAEGYFGVVKSKVSRIYDWVVEFLTICEEKLADSNEQVELNNE